MDSISSFINQYISGMANEGSCEERDLYLFSIDPLVDLLRPAY